jgi:uncharacterized protein (DUF1330 family)
MTKAYVILTEAIHDEDGMRAYEKASTPAIVESGARVLAVDASPEVLEGSWPGTRTVMLEFDSVDQASAWYDSPSYQAALPLRQGAAECNVVILAGFELPHQEAPDE